MVELSARIVEYEPSESYGVFACFCINNILPFLESLATFLSHCSTFFNGSVKSDSKCIEDLLFQLRFYTTTYYTGKISDRYVDLIGLCKVLHDKAVRDSIDSEWTSLVHDSFLSVLLHFNEFALFTSVSSTCASGDWCGLSMYFPFGCHSTSLPQSIVSYPFSGLHQPDVQFSLQPVLDRVPAFVALFDIFASHEMGKKSDFEAAVSKIALSAPSSSSSGGGGGGGGSVWVSPWMRRQMEEADANN
jgi:hypothetical protein